MKVLELGWEISAVTGFVIDLNEISAITVSVADQTATASCVHVREKLIGSRPLHLPKQEVWTIVFDWA